ncbi:odorant receptor Or1-like [Belonocnema kinseyi]|uniref:odorant receptor Or1-like n=1 Tax=Belonocnema kinseyi TaxID=2817044 RepID=UPI00143D8F67|nr:odorant receptor Or1-like [Belonocnema kinseyi]
MYHCGELKQAADHFLFWTVTVIATIKTILLRFHRDKLFNNCISARTDWLKEDDPESLKVMTQHTKISRIVFIFQAVFSYFTLVMYVISPIATNAEGEQGLPLQTVCVFRNMSVMKYQGIYLFQSIQQLYIVNGNIGTDYFFFAMIMHVCGQMKILSLRFHQFGSRGAKYDDKDDAYIDEMRMYDETFDENHDRECFRKIRILINRHCELIGLADDLKESLTYILLVQFTMDIIMMCLTGLLTLIYLQQGDTVTAGRTICGFSIVVMSLFIYCYIGDYLQFRFEKTAEAIYSCFWYNCSPKVSRNIVHMQTRGRRLMNLTAGKFCTINLEMFKTAMKTAMSFFSVMRILLSKNGDLEMDFNY